MNKMHAEALPQPMPRARGTAANGPSEVPLRLILTKLRKHRWMILSSAGLATAVAALIVWSLLPTYRAKASVLFELENRARIIEIDELVDTDGSSTEYLQTQVEVLRSRQLAETIARELALDEHWEFNDSIPTPPGIGRSGPLAELSERFRGTLSELTGMAMSQVRTLLGMSGGGAAREEARSIAARDVDETDAATDPETTLLGDAAETRLGSAVMERRKVVQVKGTNMVRISFDSADPVLAAEVANAFAREYINGVRVRKAGLTDEAAGWLSTRLEVLKAKLEEAERDLLDFRESNGLVDFQGNVGGLNEQQIGIVTRELIDARGEMQEMRVLAREVAVARAAGPEALKQLPAVAVDPVVQRYRISLQDAERELAELSNRYLERHPRVVDARSSVATIERALERQISGIAEQIERGYVIAQAKVESLESDLLNEKGAIQSLGRKQIQLLELEREVQVNNDLYQRFFNRVREAEEARGLSHANASVADPASVPQTPVAPRTTLILFSVFTLFSLGASGLVFAMEDFKDTIQGVHDVESKLGVPVVGVVPLVRGRGRVWSDENTLTPRHLRDRDGRFLESMRTLRAGIRLEDERGGAQVIMITSSVPHEGKSTIASNLAQVLGKTERVLLIEADLRRPGMSRSLRVRGPGLADVLRKTHLPSECIRRRAIDGVHLMPAGHIDDESPELLLESALAPTMNVFRAYYDRILIDSAPVQAVSDALILGKHVDTTLFVVKADDTSSIVASRGVRRLQQHGVDICGAIISQVDLDTVARYGGDHYYEGYFDKYRYGDTALHKARRLKSAA